MASQGGTVTVPAGAISVTITGAFVTPYEAALTPSWGTDVFVAPASKTTSQWVAQFNISPSVDSDADWTVTTDASDSALAAAANELWGFVTAV